MADMVRLLLDRGADAEVEDRLGRTAALYASTTGHEAIAELLQQAKARKR
jgi:ankyrin repeat protein